MSWGKIHRSWPLDCISHATRTPSQKRELKRLIDSMVEEMREMLQEIRGIFQEQMRAKLEEGTSSVDVQLLSSNTNHDPSPDHEDEL